MRSERLASQLLQLVSLIIFLQLTSFAQGPERMIDKVSWQNEPVQVVKLKTRDKNIEDWTKVKS
jgi:hypothetical protein